MCRNNVNNSYPLASRTCWARFKFLPRKYHLLYASEISMVFKIILEEENTSISYTKEENIVSNDATNFNIYQFLDRGRCAKIVEPKRIENSYKKFASIRIRFTTRLFSICIVFCDSKRQFFHFFSQIQELIVKTTPPPPPKFYYFSNALYTYKYIYIYIPKYNANFI